jgi:hypothetical protein
LPIRLQRRKHPAVLQVLAVTELSLSPYGKYRRVAFCMATDKVDEPQDTTVF